MEPEREGGKEGAREEGESDHSDSGARRPLSSFPPSSTPSYSDPLVHMPSSSSSLL